MLPQRKFSEESRFYFHHLNFILVIRKHAHVFNLLNPLGNNEDIHTYWRDFRNFRKLIYENTNFSSAVGSQIIKTYKIEINIYGFVSN